MKDYDAIVIGAGHNGLTNAAFLAKAGLRVLVLEKNDYIGGATTSRELHEGWTYSQCSYVCSLFRPEIYNALDLGRHGLKIIPLVSSMTFKQDGDFFGSYNNSHIRRRELMRHSLRDADAVVRFDADIVRWCRLVRGFLLRTPPDPGSFKPSDAFEFAYLLKKFYALSESQIYEFIRFFTMSIAEYLENYFENDTILAHYSGGSIIGTGLGVYSPGTAYVLLHHAMGDVDGNMGAWGFARGGMGAVSAALSSSLQAAGGEVRANAEVEQILVSGNRATGVRLASGEEIAAKTVVSNLDAKRTFTKVMDEDDVRPKLLDLAKKFKIRGSSGKLNIALDGMPSFPSLPEGSPLTLGHMHFTDTLRRLEKAYDDWKDDRWSADPYCDALIPSQYDPTLAPPGKHMMTVFVQYCPADPEGGWDEEKHAQFAKTVIDQIGDYSPDFKSLILHAQVNTPHEIEEQVGLTEGNIFQGELTFDQLAFQSAVSRLRAVSRPGQGHVYVRFLHSPGRRCHGRTGSKCCARDSSRPEETGHDAGGIQR